MTERCGTCKRRWPKGDSPDRPLLLDRDKWLPVLRKDGPPGQPFQVGGVWVMWDEPEQGAAK